MVQRPTGTIGLNFLLLIGTYATICALWKRAVDSGRFYERTNMQKLRQATARGFEALSRAIRQQPNYDTEVSDEYLEALGRQVDDAKPENFRLTPISEPGW